MLNGNKIIFVSTIDNKNRYYKDMTFRLWPYEKMVKELLKKENCVMGRYTHELTQWKGPKSWVLTRNSKWKSIGVGTIHDIDHFHLWMDGDIYVLGGNSLFLQMEPYVDEIHLFVFNSSNGHLEWIEIDKKDWDIDTYENHDYWSCLILKKIT